MLNFFFFQKIFSLLSSITVTVVIVFRIAGAVSTYILNEILTSTDPAFRRFAERYDWYVFPVFNPDGYAFSHNSVSI